MQTWPPKDPDEVLDYQIDWADEEKGPRLETGETLLTSVWTVFSGDVVIDSSEFVSTGLSTVWLSAGTAGTAAIMRNRVTTSEGRTYDYAARVRVRSKEG
jgi:hypothetical protein